MLRHIFAISAAVTLCALLSGCGNNSGTPTKTGPNRPVPQTPDKPPSSGVNPQQGPGAPNAGNTGGGTGARGGG